MDYKRFQPNLTMHQIASTETLSGSRTTVQSMLTINGNTP